jgi:ankyrin repeat protein
MISPLYMQYAPKHDAIVRLDSETVQQPMVQFMMEHQLQHGLYALLHRITQFEPVFLWAARNGHARILEYVLPLVDPTILEQEALTDACSNGHTDIVQLLLADPRIDPSLYDDVAIRFAASEGHLDIVSLLLQDERVDPSAYDDEALMEACAEGHVHVVERLLLDDRVDPTSEDGHALLAASRKGYTDIVKLLLQDDRVEWEDGFLVACTEGQTDTVRVFLEDSRVDAGIQDQRGMKEACAEGHVGVVQLLLQRSEVDPVCGVRRAARYGHPQVLALLLQDPRCKMVSIKDLLEVVLVDGHLLVIQMLLGYLDPADLLELVQRTDREDVLELLNAM